MDYRIDWSKIKNGYKGFEKLAVRYVQCCYDSRFEHTKDTRDGNKDARLIKDNYTIVMGFQRAEGATEEWWMEAKFSTNVEHLTRYRLDATLVSAILKGTVGRVIFVTNIDVNIQTINDIRQALICATHCQEVDFCTKDYLEYWLYRKPNILKEFFPDYHDEPIELDDMMLTRQMDFFAADRSNLVFRESLGVLDRECSYIARFSVYSRMQQEVNIRSASNLQGIVIQSSKKLRLNAGINQTEICFSLSSNYGYKSKKAKQEHLHPPSPAFKLGSLDIVSRRNITVSTVSKKTYSLPSQEMLLQTMQKYFKLSEQRTRMGLFCISGQSGVGKSYVIDAFIDSVSQTNSLLFVCEMSENQQSNLENFVRCIDFIYFPFLPADSVNKDYLDQLRNEQFFSPLYYELVCCERTAEDLGKLLARYISEDICLFPRKLYVDPRLVIIDDLHKANGLIINAIYKIALELSAINAPYMLILSGQKVRHTKYYSELSKSVHIVEEELCITDADCLALLPPGMVDLKVRHLFNSTVLFSNVIEMLFFTEYILDHGEKVNDFESFSMLYQLFSQEKIMDAYIGRLFMSATRGDEAADALCNEIYWNIGGVESPDPLPEQKLLSFHVAKLDPSTNRLVPYHDIYATFYRRHYNCRSIAEIPLVELLDGTDTNAKKTAFEKLHNEFKNQRYIFVYYSLEAVFRESASKYKNLINETDYYTLFYEYALSCAHCSLDHSGLNLFRRIYTEIKAFLHPSPQLRKICNAALWELTNSTFESLRYNDARSYASELKQNTADLIERHVIAGPLKNCIRYHNANVICSMIQSELQENNSEQFFEQAAEEMLKNGFEGRYWSYRVRYSLTLMQRSPTKAMRILSDCCDHYDMTEEGSTEKYSLWAHFYLSYMKIIVSGDRSQEDQALLYMERLREFFFNDYRKVLFGMATYFYYRDEVQKGDQLLLSDCRVLRPRRPRLEGFFHLTNAVRCVIIGDEKQALRELERASALFDAIPSYKRLIQHNISFLKTGGCQKAAATHTNELFRYYLGGPLEEKRYYLDIRNCW